MSALTFVILGAASCTVEKKPVGNQIMADNNKAECLEASAPRPQLCRKKISTACLRVSKPANFNTETYDHTEANNWKRVSETPFSTFSIDVDTASYSNIRRMLNRGEMPPKGAVRIEEMINYFTYSYPQPQDNSQPFATSLAMGECPWDKAHKLVRIAIKAKEIPSEKRPPANLVFLLDVSGSMYSQNKLPLLKTAMKMLVNNLKVKDRVAIVVYAGASGLVLPSTPCSEKNKS
ncbi:MAG: VWA domain-containing protein [Lentisphaerae bacterium]|nr:VWA domain-containing protein [Lentisphaerota bacterium]MCP4100995.1 VWA domain-containing protein [Lentisphaerota bacterium]